MKRASLLFRKSPLCSSLAAPLSIAALMACCVSAQAVTYSWITGSTGNWSDSVNWGTTDGLTPAPVGTDNTLVLTFGAPAMTADFTATNDIAVGGVPGTDFQLHSLNLTGSNAAVGTRTVTITNGSNGGALAFVGTGATVNLLANNATGGKNITFDVQSAVKFQTDTTFVGDGSGAFLLSGGVDAGGYTLAKNGKSVLTLGGQNNTLGAVTVGVGQTGNGSGNKLILAGTVSNTVGSVTVDYTNANTPTLAAASGVPVTIGRGASDFIKVAYGSASASNPHVGAVDMSGASLLTINVSTIDLGRVYQSGSPTSQSRGVMTLSNTKNDITASTSIVLGSDQGVASNNYIPLGQIIGGSGVTTIHTPSITVGSTAGTGVFTVGSTGSLTLDGISGGRAALNVGVASSGKAATSGTMTIDGNFSGKLSTMVVGQQIAGAGSQKNATGLLSLNGASNHLDISGNNSTASLQVGYLASSGNLTSAVSSSGTVSLANLDSTSTIVNTNASAPAVLIGALGGSGSSDSAAIGASGVLTLTGGSLSVQSAGTAAAIQLGSSTRTNANDSVTASLNVFGGTLSVNNDIRAASGLGSATATSTLNIDGGTLDMGSHAIGSATAMVTNVVLSSGTLKNVSEINGGQDIVKSGTGTFVLGGVNAYTGKTNVNAGTWRVNGSAASSLTTVGNTATLGGNGTLGAVQVNSGGTIDPGNDHGIIGTLTVGAATIKSGASFVLEMNNSGGATGAGSHWDQLAVNGVLDVSNLGALNQFTFKLSSLDLGTGLADWDGDVNHLWTSVITTTGGFAGTVTSDMFAIDTTGFSSNSFTGTFSIVQDSVNANNLDLLYTAAVPEPHTYGLLMFGLGAFVWRARSMRRRTA